MTIYINQEDGHEIEISCGVVNEDRTVTYCEKEVLNIGSGSEVDIGDCLKRIRHWFRWRACCGAEVFFDIYDIDTHTYLFEDEVDFNGSLYY